MKVKLFFEAIHEEEKPAITNWRNERGNERNVYCFLLNGKFFSSNL